jgi:hypothetical protein
LIYNGARIVRQQDVDHIHPQHLLNKREVPYTRVNNIANLQLLDSGTNRNEKRALELGDWIEKHVEEPIGYLSRHLIPSDKQLWKSENFDGFYEDRRRLIIEKLRTVVA